MPRPARLALACLAVLAPGCGTPGSSGPRPDPARLMGWVGRQVALGPRVPGAPAHAAGLELIRSALDSLGSRPELQSFEDSVPGFGAARLTNVLASWGPAGGERLLFVAHWDSRPWCDRDPDPARRAEPLPGANDGGSGVAVLLCLAEAFHARPPARGVDLLFVDGEDLGTPEHPEGYFRGSKRFAAGVKARYTGAVVIDLVGGRGARFTREPNSMLGAPEWVEHIWGLAGRMKLASFVRDIGPTVSDDHVPLLRAGIPAADVIDLSYPEWHTAADLPPALDPAGMADCLRLLGALAYAPRD